MRRFRLTLVGGALAAVAATVAATDFRMGVRTEPSTPGAPVTREIIAVHIGALGTDQRSGVVSAVAELKIALLRQAAANDRRFVSRLVSLEPTIELGLRHAALFGAFDEVTVGGGWTNADVVRYLGPDMGAGAPRALIPQVVLLEREVVQTDSTLHVGPEREIGRFVGVQIVEWARAGAPLPK